MLELKKNELNRVNEKPFGILLFYANGCAHCDKIKPVFWKYAELYPDIQFAQIEINEGIDYYNKFAEEEQEVLYEVVKDSNGNEVKDENGKPIINVVLQKNEDGTPKMVKKYQVPSFYVHHVDAIAENNDYGFIGAFYGSLEEELKTVCEQIMNYGK